MNHPKPSISIEDFLTRAKGKRILVIGDLMLDRYIWGKVERISPEAPVPIVDVKSETARLGGAANVGINLHALGAIPVLCGLIGNDKGGEEFLSLAEKRGFDTSLVIRSQQRQTTVKTRVLGNNQQIIRVDREDKEIISLEDRNRLLAGIKDVLDSMDALIFEDYDKGVLSKSFIRAIIQSAQPYDLPIMVDPKFKQFFDYEGVSLFKPNLKELNEGLGTKIEGNDLEGLHEGIASLKKRMPHQHTLVTLSEYGMYLVDEHKEGTAIPAHLRNISDVSGAGDTVIAVLSLGIAIGASPLDASLYANLSGGLVCEEVGVVPIDLARLREEAVRLFEA